MFTISRRTLLATPLAGLLAGCSGGPSGEPAEPAVSEPGGVATVLLLHHAQGLTDGVRVFGDKLRQAGHTVHIPDFYDGKTFPTLADGLAYAEQIGLGEIRQRGVRAADGLPSDLVYIGMSLGVMAAQQLAQTRTGARGAVLLEGCLPTTAFGAGWPETVPVHIHGMDADPVFAGQGDLDAARALVKEAADGELFLYPGNRHLFIDSSLPTYDHDTATLVAQRVAAFVATVKRG